MLPGLAKRRDEDFVLGLPNLDGLSIESFNLAVSFIVLVFGGRISVFDLMFFSVLVVLDWAIAMLDISKK